MTGLLGLHLLRLLKFVGVVAFGAGLVASYVAGSPADRRLAAHAVASPGLVVAWAAGFLLSLELGVPLTELWVLGGLATSLTAQMVLVRSVARGPATPRGFVAAAAPLFATLALMVFRPTWSAVVP